MTSYYHCDVCSKTMSQNDTIPKFEAVGISHLCYKCLNPTEFSFSADTLGEPEPSIGFCDGCDELEAEIHMIDGDWLCRDCKLQVIKAKTDKLKAQTMGLIHAEPNTKLLREELQDLKTSCTDHWEMVKARVFITLLIVWLIFAVWGKYNA